MDNKKGLLKLGYVINLKHNIQKENCITFLARLVGNETSLTDLDNFIESEEFTIEYINKNGDICDKSEAYNFRFKLPWKNKNEQHIYGYFTRKNLESVFTGVEWKTTIDFNSKETRIKLKKLGYINSSCWKKLEILTGFPIDEKSIYDYIISEEEEYYNGAGYKKFTNGDPVTQETAKFIRFSTSLKYNGDNIFGWFTKGKRENFEGISWGTEKDFKTAQKLKEQFYVGRMVFDSIESCNNFMNELKTKTIDEPWEYERRKDDKFKNPILKSYLEFELDRLFYESEHLKLPDKIIFNKTHTKLLFNTNLINKFGHDLTIVGDVLEVTNNIYISNLKISPSKRDLAAMNFEKSTPMPPTFFKDINEIIFHSDWEIDQDISKYEHIIEDRIKRFPLKYQNLPADDLGLKLDNAINFAKKIAQRNYKFIVPMYYPTAKRIQLLMPIYLETSYTSHPDFALVLTPHAEEKLYTPETILGLDEVYQDARLIAKPEESWLNPRIIE